jgi:hypothetical protein
MRLHCVLPGLAVLVAVGVVTADEFIADLAKVGDGKVTFTRGTGKKKKKEYSLPVDESCRISVARYDLKAKRIEAGDDVPGGLKNPLFEKLDKEPVQAWVRTNADNDRILELRLFQTVKKKAK